MDFNTDEKYVRFTQGTMKKRVYPNNIFGKTQFSDVDFSKIVATCYPMIYDRGVSQENDKFYVYSLASVIKGQEKDFDNADGGGLFIPSEN